MYQLTAAANYLSNKFMLSPPKVCLRNNLNSQRTLTVEHVIHHSFRCMVSLLRYSIRFIHR